MPANWFTITDFPQPYTGKHTNHVTTYVHVHCVVFQFSVKLWYTQLSIQTSAVLLYGSGSTLTCKAKVSKCTTAVCKLVMQPCFITHMPYDITKCYLLPTKVTFPPLPQPKLLLDLEIPKVCKAQLIQALQ